MERQIISEELSQTSASNAEDQGVSAGKSERLFSDAQATKSINPSAGDTSASRTRRATGPQSIAGKERTKYNALKHGIFSKAALLKDESRPQFDSLLSGLREDLKPEGTLEIALVEKLATLIWRYRRMLVAEAAEIDRVTEFLDWDRESREAEDGSRILKEESDLLGDTSNLIRHMGNPRILGKCVELLTELRGNIKVDGFNEDEDRRILRNLYGRDSHLEPTVREQYDIWFYTAQCSEEERQQNDYASADQCVANVLAALEAEIKRLTHFQRTRAAIDSKRTKLDKLRGSVPNSPALDRLLRYEASIERAFDRTLIQLERLQRMRLGQAVLPPIKLDVSQT